jgi:hypothetical protein
VGPQLERILKKLEDFERRLSSLEERLRDRRR